MKEKVTFEESGEKEKEEADNIVEHISCSNIKLTARDLGVDRDSSYCLSLLSSRKEGYRFKLKCKSVLGKKREVLGL